MNAKNAQSRIQLSLALEMKMLPLYGAYLYLRDHDLSEESNTSRLLQEHSKSYLLSRLSDELQEMADVQSGEHGHTDRQSDTILEGSQVGYWLLLLAGNDFAMIVQGLQIGFALIGWACAEAGVSPLDPAEFDLAQMRRKGLIGQ